MATPKIEISQEFIKLVANIGSEVTNRVYPFLTFYGDRRHEDYELAGGSRKKGKKKEINAKEKVRLAPPPGL